ncbi:MAG: Ig-like domain-containing protein [Planctomycetota bacterium]
MSHSLLDTPLRCRAILLLAITLMPIAACETQIPLPGLGDPGVPLDEDSNIRNVPAPTEEPPTTQPTETPPPTPPPTVYPDVFVMTNRQKVIGLPAWIEGVEYDNLTITISSPPVHGVLVGTPPNLTYHPAPDYEGLDAFTYAATDGTTLLNRAITLSVAKDFVPPVGIPTPPFGIAESHQMYANQLYDFGGQMLPYPDAGNGPYTHYVNFDNGTNAGNPFGTAALPRRSIPSDLPAGSVVELHGTNVATSARYTITGDGTAAKPIFIRGPSASNKTIFRRPFSVEGNYVICENIEFDAQDFVTGMVGANWFVVVASQLPPYKVFHHVALRHTIIRDQPTNDTENPFGIVAGVGAYDVSLNDPNMLIENVVIYDVEIGNFSQWNDYAGTNDYGGCLFAANLRNAWVLDCHFHHLRGDGVSVCRSNALLNQTPARQVYVGRNYLHHFKENCIDYKHGVTSIASQNVCHTVRASNSSQGHAITIHDDDSTADWPASDNVWIILNTIYDAEMGIYHENNNLLPAGKQSRSYLVGNLLFDIRYMLGNPNLTGWAIQKGQEAQSRIIGNTIWKCDQGIQMGFSALTQPANCTQVVRNNAIVDLSERVFQATGLHAMHLFHLPSSINPYTTIENNLHYESVGVVRFNISKPGLQAGNYYTVLDMLTATGFGAGSLAANPMFSTATSPSFYLQAASPALSAGVDDESYALFEQQFGRSIRFNLDGRPKTTGVYDIGALGVAP